MTMAHSNRPFFQNQAPRRSGRLQGTQQQNLDEDAIFRKHGLLDHFEPKKRPRYMESSGSRTRTDSGLGIRRQGGRIYDSKHGVTCHWCRQKTLEDHVVCTSPHCGGGKSMPVSFCRMCLMNRHGEDVYLSESSGKWICPRCRGSCGNGCTLCCNCGPCRRKHGLAPTHQMIKEARTHGFNNVHDYLIHLRTGEDQYEISSRKILFPWGAWLDASHEEDSDATQSQNELQQLSHDENDETVATSSKPYPLRNLRPKLGLGELAPKLKNDRRVKRGLKGQ